MRKADEPEGEEYRLVVRFPGNMGFKLKELAERNRRSINNEILCLVESGIEVATGRQA